jgi:ankyrin repeat protein
VYHTALSIASSKGYDGVVLALLEAGASINQKLAAFDDSDVLHRITALNYAIENGRETIVKLLIERGADFHTAYAKSRWFSRCRSPYLIDLFLVAGMDINAVDTHKQTLIFHMVSDGQTENVRILAERAASLDLMTDVGDFALYAATREGHEEIVKLLLDHNVDTKGVEKEVWLQRAGDARRRYDDTVSLSNRRRDHEQSPYLRCYFYHDYDEGSTPKPFDAYSLRELFGD